MPDHSSAAREHALLSEIVEPLAKLPEDPVQFTADVEFPVALRGYDRVAVDAYVRRTCQLVAELQARTSPQAAVRRAVERFGEEVSGILARAHETAAEITARSRREAEERLERARREVQELTAAAQERVRQLDADTDRIWEERERIIADARELAGQLAELADDAARRMGPLPAQALGSGAGRQPGSESIDAGSQLDAGIGIDAGSQLDAEIGVAGEGATDPGSDQPTRAFDARELAEIAAGAPGGEDEFEVGLEATVEREKAPGVDLGEAPGVDPEDAEGREVTIAMPPRSAGCQPFDFESEPDETLPEGRDVDPGQFGPLGFADPPGDEITARPGLEADRLL